MSPVFKTPFCRGYWQSAVRSAKDRRTLVLAAVLTALLTVLYVFVTVPVSVLGTEQRISAAFLVSGVTACLVGPVLALPVGILVDTISFLLRPSGPYMPLFALVWVVQLTIYALFLYRQRLTVLRIALAKTLVTVVCNIVLDSTLMYFLYSGRHGYFIYLLARIPKNLILLPFEIVALSLLFAALSAPLEKRSVLPAGAGLRRGTKRKP